MDTRSLCQLCLLMVIIFLGVTDAVWTLTGSSEFAAAGESFTLTCNPQDTSGFAKSISWRRSGTLLAYIDYTSTCIIGNGSNQQYQYTCEPGPIYKLTIPANVMTNSQNNIVWKCDSQFGGTSNTAEYTLTVADAVWTLTGSSEFAAAGESFTLTCNPQDTSNFAKYISWRRSGALLANIDYTSTCIIGNDSNQQYQYTCESGPIYKLTIPANVMTNSQNNILWRCESQFGGSGNNAEYTLTVSASPTGNPVITGYDVSPRLPGNNVPLTCTVNGGIPLATLSWSCKGTSVPGTALGTSTHTITIDTSYNGQRCTCTASHPTWTVNKVVQSQVFVVHYKPTTDPVLSGYDGSVHYQGDTLTLTCQVSGGSPLATLSWTCGGQQQVASVSTSGTTVTSVLTLTLVIGHNGKTCICHGRHSDPSYTPDISSQTFIVYYPPNAPGLFPSQSTPFPWIAAGQGTLGCVSQPGYPPTITYQWIRENVVIPGQTGASLTLTSLTKNDNRQSYKCKVSNEYTVYKNVNLVSQPRLLDVEYRPVIDIGTSPAYVIEAGTFERTCTADGNPTPSITWTPNINPSNGATLRLTNVMRNQTGDYTCKAQARSNGAHGLLSNQAVLNVIVQYPPSVSAVFSSSSITEGQGVTMVCLAQGIPDQYTYNGWTQIHRNTIIRSSNDFSILSQNKRNLTLLRVSYQDIGTYRCSANNDIPDEDGNTNQNGVKDLDIKFSAVFNSSTKFYAELNRTVEIKIPFLSNPFVVKANISLTKNNIKQKGSDISVSVGNRNLEINFYGKVINVNGQEVIVTLHHFSSKLQGKYTIGVKNYQGGPLSTFVFEVIPSGPPENPKYFGILSKTSNSITVTWLKGFNGGHSQTFVVLYRQKDIISHTFSSQEIMEEDNRDNYTLRITDLSPLTKYDFWIYSYNIHGNSTRDFKSLGPLVIQTDELEQLETGKTYASGIAIGIVIGFITGVLIESIVISFLLWRKGFWNECKCISGNKADKNENQQKTQYEDINSGIEDTNVYDGINSEGAQNNPESLREGEYEHLDHRPESTDYQQLQNKGAENIQMGSVYVNTKKN